MKHTHLYFYLAVLTLLSFNCTDPQSADFLQNIIDLIKTNPRECPDDQTPPAKNCFTIDEHTLGLWAFNEKDGLLSDNQIQSRDTLKFEKKPLQVETKYGKASNLDSNAASIVSAECYFPEKITVEARIKIDRYPSLELSPQPHSMIVSTVDWDASETKGYELRITDTDGKAEFSIGTSKGWLSAISKTTLELGTWYTVAGQYDGAYITVFVNGILAGKTACMGPINKSLTGLGVGRRVVDQPFYFWGSIDEVAISNVCRYNYQSDNWYTTDVSTIAHWTFDEYIENGIVDISGNGHFARCIGTPVSVPGKAGNAFDFNRYHCTTPTSSSFYPQLITVEAAVKLSAYPASTQYPRPHMMIVSTVNWSGINSAGYELRISDTTGRVEFIFGDLNGWHYIKSERTLPLNEWHSVAGQYDGSTISVFVDGELWGQTVYKSTIQKCNTDIGIASRLVDQPFYFIGMIDEIRISGVLRN
jgi:hypothetical protein